MPLFFVGKAGLLVSYMTLAIPCGAMEAVPRSGIYPQSRSRSLGYTTRTSTRRYTPSPRELDARGPKGYKYTIVSREATPTRRRHRRRRRRHRHHHHHRRRHHRRRHRRRRKSGASLQLNLLWSSLC